MSDFKEKETGEEMENTPNNNLPNDDDRREVEELAALLQQELDKAKAEAEKGGAVSDWDNLAEVGSDFGIGSIVAQAKEEAEENEEAEEEDEEEEIDESLCILCGENERETDENGEYISDYCENCKDSRLHTHVSWLGTVLFALVAIALVFSGREFGKVQESYTALMKADALRMDKMYSSAADGYLAAVSGDVQSPYAVKQMFKCFLESDQVVYISEFAAELGFDETALAKPWNRSIKKAAEKSDKVNNTSAAAADAVNEQGKEDGTLDFNAASKALDAIAGKSEYDPAIIEYYRYYAASVANQPIEEQYKILSANKAHVKAYPWLFMPKMAALQIRMGNHDEALKLCDDMLKTNAEFADAYILRIYSARMQKDYDKAIKEAETAALLFNGSEGGEGAVNKYAIGEIYRQESIAHLLKGETEKGIAVAEKAQANYQSVDSTNLLGICYILNGDTAKYTETENFLKQYGYEYLDDVVSFKSGKTTLEELFLKDGGELQ